MCVGVESSKLKFRKSSSATNRTEGRPSNNNFANNNNNNHYNNNFAVMSINNSFQSVNKCNKNFDVNSGNIANEETTETIEGRVTDKPRYSINDFKKCTIIT